MAQPHVPAQEQPPPGHHRSALTGLAPGEHLLHYAIVVPVKNAKGVALNAGGLIGNHLMQTAGAQGGNANSIAASCPDAVGGHLMRVTDQRVGLVNARTGAATWEIPRTWVTRVERRPRLQIMARFKVHYSDGSWLAFMTTRRRHIEAFRALIGG